jgi:uncharacterized protein (TIGR03435 family)
MVMQVLASTLLHFLWQGVLIALAYGVARRHPNARFRYAAGCAAMLLMAVTPVATFVVLSPAAAPAVSEHGVVKVVVSAVKETGANDFISLGAARDSARNWIVLGWMIGVFVFSMRLLAAWTVSLRLRSSQSSLPPKMWQRKLDELRAHLNISRPVRLVVSATTRVPVTAGWLRPVVLVPLGALSGLGPELLEALLAHELAHIRRHDYLVNLLQGVTEAVLFYHPAVWWVSRRIREERELCCDDAAVSICGDALTYVRALTELESQRCRSINSASINPALAANGGSLAARVARLLGVRQTQSRSAAPGLILAVAMAGALFVNAQPQVVPASSLPAFDVASIKASSPDAGLKVDFAAGGRLVITHGTLRFLIKIAYDVTDDQIVGGPSWINSTRFDLEGKLLHPKGGDPQTMTKEQILLFHGPTRLRLQRLLADRFQLELRKDSKAMPVFALVAGKNGPKLKASTTTGAPEITFDHGILQAKRMDMPTLARFLSEGQVGRPVEDATGISGLYDLRLEWTPDPNLNPLQAAAAQAPADTGISIFSALQQQLGLRLEPKTDTADTLVVTRAELPSAN